MVFGQYALVCAGMIWVNENDEVRIDGDANIETEESASPYESHVYAVMLNEGIVLDLVQNEQDKPIKIDKIPLAKVMDEESFDLSDMIDIVWVVNTEREQDRLCEIYKEQTGHDLYDIEDDVEETSPTETPEQIVEAVQKPAVATLQRTKKRVIFLAAKLTEKIANKTRVAAESASAKN
jgi:hypothetical protein